MAANTFAIESTVRYVSALVDRDKHADVRLEAAIAKLWGSERAWEIVDDTMQIRGGRGYETADSLHERGEVAEPVERLMRDSRINTIFEGSSEIMRLFIAREALDPHLKVGAAAVNTSLPLKARAVAAMKAARFYAKWYPLKLLPLGAKTHGVAMHPALRREMNAIARQSRKLARTLFHAMALNGPKLEKMQLTLGRFVDIGAELFVWSCTAANASSKLIDLGTNSEEGEKLLKLVRYFGKITRCRIAELFRALHANADREGYALVKGMME